MDAYKRAGLTVNDIDVFETHDCFTSSGYVVISAFGLTEAGIEYEAIESGLIAFDGAKPINSSGGLIAVVILLEHQEQGCCLISIKGDWNRLVGIKLRM